MWGVMGVMGSERAHGLADADCQPLYPRVYGSSSIENFQIEDWGRGVMKNKQNINRMRWLVKPTD